MGRFMGSIAALGLMASAAFAQQHSQCWLQQQGMLNSGTNPTDAEVLAEAQSLASTYDIPYEIILAIAYQESGIRHFASDGFLVHNQTECAGLFNGATSPNPPGLGMMQLTGGTAQSYNLTLLRTDWTYNLESGIKVLNGKFAVYKSNAGGALGAEIEANRHLVENWYMAAWYYNGYVGNSGSYADKIFAHIQNRPGKLVNLLPAGLNPTEPDIPFSHFFNDPKGEEYVARADGSWLCSHGTTATAPVIVTGNGGGSPPPPAPAPAPDGTRREDPDGNDGNCAQSAGGSAAGLVWLAAAVAAFAAVTSRSTS
jgi:hypothetical protein